MFQEDGERIIHKWHKDDTQEVWQYSADKQLKNYHKMRVDKDDNVLQYSWFINHEGNIEEMSYWENGEHKEHTTWYKNGSFSRSFSREDGSLEKVQGGIIKGEQIYDYTEVDGTGKEIRHERVIDLNEVDRNGKLKRRGQCDDTGANT